MAYLTFIEAQIQPIIATIENDFPVTVNQYWKKSGLAEKVNVIVNLTDNRLLNAQFFELVEMVIQARNISVARLKMCNSVGRILVCSPVHNMADCLAQGETPFFNEYDVPSYHSWLGYVYDDINVCGYLLAWIPNKYVDEVNEGIEVSGYSLFWASDLENVKSYDEYLYYVCLNLLKIIELKS